MKLSIKTIFFFLILSSSILAQDKKVNFEFSIGPTISLPKTQENSANFNTSTDTKTNIGFFGQAGIRLFLNEKTSMNTGIGYYLDRFSVEFSNPDSPVKNWRRNIHQFQIPIGFDYHFGINKSFSVGLGGFVNFTLSANEKGEIDFPSNEDRNFLTNADFDNEIKDRYNTINFGAFLILRKEFQLTQNLDGFVLLKVNQYINSIQSIDIRDMSGTSIGNQQPKDPTVVNIGFGIQL